MARLRNILLCVGLFLTHTTIAQIGSISGHISDGNSGLELVYVDIKGKKIGTFSDENGNYIIENLREGKYELEVTYTGFESQIKTIEISKFRSKHDINFQLVALDYEFNQVVVTGTKTFERRTQTPVIVNVVGSKTLQEVQACNLSEGLKFQPGLRIETDCQTCNYTQLRMNGLAGGYSQILINGRPIFSPLTGLYGMEQIPVNMIERIEIVRGGGSALYGSSAIGGTVNVITKIPNKSGSEINWTSQLFGKNSSDNIISGNATVVNKDGKNGITLFVNNRIREMYDHNGDNFSELPKLGNNSFGLNAFYLLKKDQKIEFSLSSINESRYGGEMVDGPAHLAKQSEDRDHKVLVGSVDYQKNFKDERSSLIAFGAAQQTKRKHYTGILPDDADEYALHLSNPPYGNSLNTTLQGGVQFNHQLKRSGIGRNVITSGLELVSDDVLDVIESYNYEIDQVSSDLGFYFQSNWKMTPRFTLLSGLRIDKHNLVENIIYSPRFSALYRFKNSLQVRATFGTGFRAPQAFDTDMHLAFAAGGISRIALSNNLEEERSKSYNLSINYDKVEKYWIAGFTLEAFHTKLDNAFYLHPLGEDGFGQRFEKRNGSGSIVQGMTLEVRANLDKKFQLESGLTIQKSLYNEAVENIVGLPKSSRFLRTPNEYAYGKLSWTPNSQWVTTINSVHTGSMLLTHFAGAPEQEQDEYYTSPVFHNFGIRIAHKQNWKGSNLGMEVFGGIKNILNSYQNNFDSGKNRDSNFIFGPSNPRTYFIGVRLLTG